MAEWHTPQTVRKGWAGAPASDELIESLLAAAKVQCLVYALGTMPAADAVEQTTIPDTWRLAHQAHTIDLYSAMQTGDQPAPDGLDGLQQRRPRMAGMVRSLLLPSRGGPAVG